MCHHHGMDDPRPAEAPPEPGRTRVRSWMRVMAAVAVFLAIAVVAWVLTRGGSGDATVVEASGPQVALTVERPLVGGTIDINGSAALVAAAAQGTIELTIDAGADGAALDLVAVGEDVPALSRFVVGNQIIRLTSNSWRLRCGDTAACRRTIEYHLSLPVDADRVAVNLGARIRLTATDDFRPGPDAVSIVFGEPLTEQAPGYTGSVGGSLDAGAPVVGAVEIALPPGFDDPSLSLTLFARGETAATAVETGRLGRPRRARTQAGGLRLNLPGVVAACPGRDPCRQYYWVVFDALPDVASDASTWWVEATLDGVEASADAVAMRLETPEAVVASGSAPPVQLTPLRIDSEGEVDFAWALLVPTTDLAVLGEGRIVRVGAFYAVELCGPGCPLEVQLRLDTGTGGSTAPGSTTAPPPDTAWGIAGFLVGRDEIISPNRGELLMGATS